MKGSSNLTEGEEDLGTPKPTVDAKKEGPPQALQNHGARKRGSRKKTGSEAISATLGPAVTGSRGL